MTKSSEKTLLQLFGEYNKSKLNVVAEFCLFVSVEAHSNMHLTVVLAAKSYSK